MKISVRVARHPVMCGRTWGICGRQGNKTWMHVCNVWILPGERHTHICGTCGSN